MTTNRLQRIAIYGCIINKTGEILIIKRSETDSSPNIWEMPGGNLENGESIIDGIIREVLEETGLNVLPLYPVAATSVISHRDPTKQILRIAYLAKMNSLDQPITLSNEHSEFIWINPLSNITSQISDILEEVILHIKKYPYVFSV